MPAAIASRRVDKQAASRALQGRFSAGVRWQLVGLAAMLMVVLACASSTALAEPAHPNYVLSGSFSGPGEAPEDLREAKRIAVDQATGEILVTDFGHHRVAVFSPELGPSAAYLTEFGNGVLSKPFGIAIDRASGDVYVSDAGSNRIVRFTSDGGPVPTYTVDPSFVSPALGTGTGQVGSFAAALAVDPTTHDLLVADPVGRRVSRFTASGAFVGSFDGSGSPEGVFANPLDIAVGPTGSIYVTNVEGDIFNGGSTQLDRFQPDGAFDGELRPVPFPLAVTVNQETGMVVAGADPGFLVAPNLYGFIGDEAAGQGQAEFTEFTAVEGLAIDTGATGRLYALTSGEEYNSGPTGVQVFTPVPAPGVSVAAPTEVAPTSVRLQGSVDAGGHASTPHFEYSADAGVTWTSLAAQAAITGTGEVAIHVDLTGLEPAGHYLVRLVAVNSETSSTSSQLSFTTAGVVPTAVTAGVSGRSASAATLNGRVNPLGLQSTYRFEYGTSSSYGGHLPLTGDVVVGSGRAPLAVSAILTGLTPGTVYHYRLVAQSAAGTTDGEDMSFTAPTVAEAPSRAYEQVTPVDKRGEVLNALDYYQASADGEGLVFQARKAGNTPDTFSVPLDSRFLSRRGSAGWEAQVPLDAPQLPKAQAPFIASTIGVSADLSHALVISNLKLTDGAVDGHANFYLRDTRTGAYQFVASGSEGLYEQVAGLIGSNTHFYGGSRDFSTVVFGAPESLTADAPKGVENLYEFSGGSLRLASVMPDGSPAVESLEVPYYGSGLVSEDGSQVVFAMGGVYLRRAGHTVAISVSHRSGDDPTVVHPANLYGATPDGRYVFFRSNDTSPLTPNAPEAAENVYRYDRVTNVLEFVDKGGEERDVFSESGEGMFLANTPRLWRNGTLSTVSTPADVVNEEVSPNGRYVAFLSHTQLTSDDDFSIAACPTYNGRCAEVYLYDAQTQTLSCASCAADGALPAGEAHTVETGPSELSKYIPRFVNDLGEVFFDTPTSLVAADVNGSRDVYEYRAGEAHLITRGTLGTTSRFVDSSADGSNVFFTTDDRLVGQDTDSALDMYDARIGGGFAAQNPPAPAPTCGAGQCPGSSGAGVLPAIGSVDFVGVAPAASVRATAHLAILKKTVEGAAFTLSVRVPQAGRITAAGSGFVQLRKSVAKAGSYSLKLGLTAAEKHKLGRLGKLSLKLRVSYVPRSGQASATVVPVSLSQAKPTRKRAVRTAGRAGR